MTVPLNAITAICRSVVAQQAPSSVEVLGVVSSDGDSERVEVLVTIAGCHPEPCLFALNLTRTSEAELEKELRFQLREALQAHGA